MKLFFNYKGYIYLLGAVLAYSSMPVLIRTLDEGAVPPAAQVFLRYVVSFSLALSYFVLKGSRFNFKKGNIFFLVLLGVCGYGLTNLFFTYSFIYTEIGNALFLFYSFGIMTPILAFFVLKEKLNRFNWIGLIITFIAIALLFRPNSFDTWKLGGVFALLAALGQSIYIIGRRKFKEYSSELMMLSSTFLGVVSIGVISFLLHSDFYFEDDGIGLLTSETWITIIIFGILNFLGWLLMSKGFEHVKAKTGSIFLLSENVLAVLWGLVVFSEIPSLAVVFGGLMIILATILVTVKGDKL